MQALRSALRVSARAAMQPRAAGNNNTQRQQQRKSSRRLVRQDCPPADIHSFLCSTLALSLLCVCVCVLVCARAAAPALRCASVSSSSVRWINAVSSAKFRTPEQQAAWIKSAHTTTTTTHMHSPSTQAERRETESAGSGGMRAHSRCSRSFCRRFVFSVCVCVCRECENLLAEEAEAKSKRSPVKLEVERA